MRILTRHVLAQLTATFLFSLIALTLLFVIGGAVREAVSQSLPPAQVLRLIPYMLPEWLRYTVPITLLLAATSVYARLSGSNEVVALKALGISPMAVLWPAFAMALVLSLVTVWLNDLAVSWGRRHAQQVIVEGVEDIAYSMLRTHKQYDSPAFSINVSEVRGRKLILPIVSVKEPAMIFTADEAELRLNRREKILEIILYNCKVDGPGAFTFDYPGEYRHEFPLAEASRSAGSATAASALSLDTVREQITTRTEDIIQYRRQMAALAAHEVISGDFDSLSGRQWQTRRNVLAAKMQQLHKLQAEPYRRWAAGFSCFCFLWVGAPMAVRRRNSDFLTSFFLCFLPILIVYYPFLIYTIDASKTGTLPPISLWAGNAVLAVWGAYLLRKVLRY